MANYHWNLYSVYYLKNYYNVAVVAAAEFSNCFFVNVQLQFSCYWNFWWQQHLSMLMNWKRKILKNDDDRY